MTPEQTKANDDLEAAIQASLVSTGWAPNGIITAWVVVGHILPFEADTDGDDKESYFRIYAGGSQPSHIVTGLLDAARTYMAHGLINGYGSDDSDE